MLFRMADSSEAQEAEAAPEPVQQGAAPRPFVGKAQRAGRLFMLTVRLLFMVLLLTVTILTVASVRDTRSFDFSIMLGLGVASAAVGLIVVVVDAMTPNKRLASVVGIYIGVVVGLVAAVAFGALIDMVMSAWELDGTLVRVYVNLAKVVIGFIICYLTVSVVLTTKDDFRLVIPYVEFARQRRGIRPLLVDSSALIDGRLLELAASGFLDAPLAVPTFVLEELQTLADSADATRRARGRRGLDVVARLQESPFAEVSLEEAPSDGLPVDRLLIDMARKEGMRIVSTDVGLQKLGRIQSVQVLNLNDLAASLRPAAAAGDVFTVTIAKPGENPGQGVGYLQDGTMVVVEDAAARVGETLPVTVTNTLQTAAGRLLFARHEPRRADGTPSVAPQMAAAAVSQPRTPPRVGPRGESSPPGRNPRR